MTIYLAKLVLCSALFFGVYKLLFERENMLGFNRTYLLSSSAGAFVIAALTWNAHTAILPTVETTILNMGVYPAISKAHASISNGSINTLPFLLLTIYVMVTSLLLFRFGRNLKILFSSISNNPLVSYQNATLVLVSEATIPYSFLNYIFINREAYQDGHIESEVLHHELAHVRQKHSLDVLFMELLQAVIWFNPVFALYRNAIRLNHEFLADASVIKECGNTRRYQQLLLGKASQKHSFSVASLFNYSTTKKRLIMMTKTTSRERALCKQLAVLPLSVLAVLMFSVRTVAQDTTGTPVTPAPAQQNVTATNEGVSQQLLDEYAAITDKYNKLNEEHPKPMPVSETDMNRLKTIYLAMSKPQQARQAIQFIRPDLSGRKLTEKQFEVFKQSKSYAVTIDDRKVDNNVLNKYRPSDFGNFYIAYLAKTNKNYGKHLPIDVYLMTKEYHKAHVKKLSDEKAYVMVITRFVKTPQ